MKKNLSCVIANPIVCAFLVMIVAQATAQTWSFRNGYGSPELGPEKATGVCVDAGGNVYMTGVYTGSSTNFGTGTLPTADGADGFVVKFNAAGVCQWTIRFGGTSGLTDQGQGICTDGSFVYVTGFFHTSMTVGSSPTVYNSHGANNDGFVMKLDAGTGATSWVTTFGGNSTDNSQAICLDGSGNIYITGLFFTSASFGSFTRNANGGSSSDLFVARLNGATGIFDWASTGGSSSATDNPNGSSVCYVPGLNEVIVTGSYVDQAATYSTVTPASTVNLPITAGNHNDICLLEVNAANGAFLSGFGIGGSGNEEGLGVTYDPSTQDVVMTGYYASSSITFPGTAALTNAHGNADVFYARFNPNTNNFIWAKGGGGSDGPDWGSSICSNGIGGILITGRYRGTAVFPTSTGTKTIVSPRTNLADDIFMGRINVSDGNMQFMVQGAGTNDNNLANQGNAIAPGPSGSSSVWVAGSYATPLTFNPLSVLPVAGVGPDPTSDIFLARSIDPPPLAASTSKTDATCNQGCNGTATVTPSGGLSPYTYSWAPSGGSAATASGLCPGNYTATITDNLGLMITKNFTISIPAITIAPSTTSNAGFPVSSNNTQIADAGCNLIATLDPFTAMGNVGANVWVEGSVPEYFGMPFVARHYQLTPSLNPGTANGRVTLYFLQSEFDAFNAHPKSGLKLPMGPLDALGKSNLRVGKYPGSSSGGGLPGSYSGVATVIDPDDGAIIYNAIANRWEVSFNVTGFSGFIVQSSPTPLPLTWLNITGTLDARSRVNINWEVEEQQVAGYDVERSTDGTHYSSMATLVSQGDGRHVYHYAESQALDGMAYYRIRQTDKDGRYTFSKTLIMKGQAAGNVTVYPNPSKGMVTINITERSLMNTTARLYDIQGKELQQVRIVQSVTSLNLGNYKPGTYMLRLQNGATVKLLKE